MPTAGGFEAAAGPAERVPARMKGAKAPFTWPAQLDYAVTGARLLARVVKAMVIPTSAMATHTFQPVVG